MEYSIGSVALVLCPGNVWLIRGLILNRTYYYLRSSNHVNARNLFRRSYVCTSIRSVIQIFIYTDFRMSRYTSEWAAVVPTFNTHRNTFIHPSTRSEGWLSAHPSFGVEDRPFDWLERRSFKKRLAAFRKHRRLPEYCLRFPPPQWTIAQSSVLILIIRVWSSIILMTVGTLV